MSRIVEAVARVLASERGEVGIACSGGADSIALAHATFAVVGAGRVVVLTVDHGLRADSARVADEVVAWAQSLGARATAARVSVESRASLEAAAREARYAALDALAAERGIETVLVGHTARDQAETVLMRVLRGTGPAGLAAMAPRRGRFVRPLLAIDRAEIEAYVAAHALPTWLDDMNADARFTRVRVREQLLPMLARENPRLESALVRLAVSTREWLDVIDERAAPFARFPIDCRALAREPAAIRKRALAIALEAARIDHDATHLDALDALVCAPTAGQRALDVPDATLVRTYDALEPRDARSPTAATLQPDDASARADELRAPPGYTVRAWQPGDRMRPRRLRGHSRKLSDLFTDAKVPRELRARARVVVAADGAIVWAEHVGLAFEAPESAVPTHEDQPPPRAGRDGKS